MGKSIKSEGAATTLVAEFNGYGHPPMVEGFWRPPLLAGFDDVWDLPMASLPKRLKQLVDADPVLCAHWDWLHQHERRLLVEQQDARRDPGQQRAQEGEDFAREARRQELETERDQHSRLAVVSSIDMEAKRHALARIDAELAAIDREQAAAEQQSDPDGKITIANSKVEPLALAEPDRVPQPAPMPGSQSSVETGARGGAARAAKYKPFKDWVQTEAASVPGHPRSIARALADRLPAKLLDISTDPARMIYRELVRMEKIGTRG